MVLLKKFNILREYHLLCSLLIKNVQIYKFTLINLNLKKNDTTSISPSQNVDYV